MASPESTYEYSISTMSDSHVGMRDKAVSFSGELTQSFKKTNAE